MIEIKPYVKRLTTVQNMTDVLGVKELCEIVMELLEELEKEDSTIGFKK